MPKENPASDSLRECAMYLASTVSSLSLSEKTVAQKNILLISPSKQRQLHFLITLEFQLKSAVLILHFATSLHFTLSLHVHVSVMVPVTKSLFFQGTKEKV